MSVKKTTKGKKGVGHIYKVKDTFYLQYRDANHKRCNITLKTASGKKITEEREARTAAKCFLERQQKIQEIETQETYLRLRCFEAKILFEHRKYNPSFYFFPVEISLKQGLYLRLFFQGNEC